MSERETPETWHTEFERYQLSHDPPYFPKFDHVYGAPAIGIGEKCYIDSGPEPRRNDATDHLFHE